MPIPLIAFAVAAKATETALVWYYAGAAVCVVAGGGTAYWMLLPNGKQIPLTLDQVNQIKTDHDEIIKREQRPEIIAKSVMVNTSNQVKTVIDQTCEQQIRTDIAVRQFNQTAINANKATTLVNNIAQPLQAAANDAINNIQAMKKELALAQKHLEEETHALQRSQASLSEIEDQLRDTRDKLSSSQEQLAITTTTACSQLLQLTDLQQRFDDVFNKMKTGTVHDAELEVMKQQVEKLSSRNQSLTNIVNKLSHNTMIAIEDSKTLRSENIALKKTIASFAPEEQGIQRQTNSEPAHANPYKLSMFR